MDKAKEHNKESNNSNNSNGKKRFHRHKHHQRNHKKETAPTWDFEKKGAELPETKADLMMILEEVNPEELLMVSLVKQNKELKLIKKVDQEEVNTEDTDTPLESTESTEPTEKVKINLSRNCPICEKPIREIMYALHDYDHDQLAHFDCVYKKVLVSVKEKLTDKRYLAYLGSGSFGIMDPGNGNKQRITLIEKIYPGAPLEELLHGDENIKDEEL